MAPLPPDSSTLLSDAIAIRTGARLRSSTVSNRNDCGFGRSRTVTASGSMRGAGPSVPAMPDRRSCWIAPTVAPRMPTLNEIASLGTIVAISAVASGSRTSPDWKNGWPNASTRP